MAQREGLRVNVERLEPKTPSPFAGCDHPPASTECACWYLNDAATGERKSAFMNRVDAEKEQRQVGGGLTWYGRSVAEQLFDCKVSTPSWKFSDPVRSVSGRVVGVRQITTIGAAPHLRGLPCVECTLPAVASLVLLLDGRGYTEPHDETGWRACEAHMSAARTEMGRLCQDNIARGVKGSWQIEELAIVDRGCAKAGVPFVHAVQPPPFETSMKGFHITEGDFYLLVEPMVFGPGIAIEARTCGLDWCSKRFTVEQQAAVNYCSPLCSDFAGRVKLAITRCNDFTEKCDERKSGVKRARSEAREKARSEGQRPKVQRSGRLKARFLGEREWARAQLRAEYERLRLAWQALQHESPEGDERCFPMLGDE